MQNFRAFLLRAIHFSKRAPIFFHKTVFIKLYHILYRLPPFFRKNNSRCLSGKWTLIYDSNPSIQIFICIFCLYFFIFFTINQLRTCVTSIL